MGFRYAGFHYCRSHNLSCSLHRLITSALLLASCPYLRGLTGLTSEQWATRILRHLLVEFSACFGEALSAIGGLSVKRVGIEVLWNPKVDFGFSLFLGSSTPPVYSCMDLEHMEGYIGWSQQELAQPLLALALVPQVCEMCYSQLHIHRELSSRDMFSELSLQFGSFISSALKLLMNFF